MSLDGASTTAVSGNAAVDSAPRTRLEYFRAYQALLDSPNWGLTLLWGFLAIFSSGLVPLVGGMVWTGYLYECVEQLHHSRGRHLPDFDVNRFGDYLTRGVFPFLVQLVIWMTLLVCYFLVYVFMFGAAATIEGVGEEHATIVLATTGMLYLLTVGMVLLTPMILLAPLMLRLGLSQDLSIGFHIAWWGDFLRRMWLELFLSTLFVVLTGFVMTTLGCLLLILGSYAAWAWVTIASAHLSWQLYELYLARGGAPVPLKPRQRIPPPLSPPGITYLPPQQGTM